MPLERLVEVLQGSADALWEAAADMELWERPVIGWHTLEPADWPNAGDEALIGSLELDIASSGAHARALAGWGVGNMPAAWVGQVGGPRAGY